jgi:hypothetical protein
VSFGGTKSLVKDWGESKRGAKFQILSREFKRDEAPLPKLFPFEGEE